MTKNDYLVEKIKSELANYIHEVTLAYDEVTIECAVANINVLLLKLLGQ